MSQQVFADRLGKSKSWVDKVERGVRRLDKFSVLYEIADVLHLDVQLLLGKAPARRAEHASGGGSGAGQIDISGIRSALERYDMLAAHFGADEDPPDLGGLAAGVDHAWHAWQRADYPAVARHLPELLLRAQTADAVRGESDRRRAADLLGQVYQVTSATLNKLGEHHLAWLAADRATTTAIRCGDPLPAAAAAIRVSTALLALGRSRPALEIALTAAHHLTSDANGDDPARLSIHGALLLHAALAAAPTGDTRTVRELLITARHTARRLGRDHEYHRIGFGPTHVRIHHATAAVELGDAHHAITIHASIPTDRFHALAPERRAHHLLDVARAHTHTGDLHHAARTLVETHQLAPAEIRHRPLAREAITDILRRSRNTPPAALAELAKQLGIAL